MRRIVLVVMMVLGVHLGLASRLQALSVGDIVVQSHRGEPFKAEVSFTLESQEREKHFAVRLGDPKEYQTEGLTRAAVLDHLKTRTTSADVIQIFSEVPIDEPILAVLLLVRSGQLTIVRSYHVALSKAPPPLAAKPARVAQAASSGSLSRTAMPRSTASEPPASTLRHPAPPPALASVTTAPVTPRRAPPAPPATAGGALPAPPRRTSVAPLMVSVAAAPESSPTPTPAVAPAAAAAASTPPPSPSSPAAAAQRYGPIKPGETLYGIVQQLRLPNDKLWQAVVVLWHANQTQFLRGNLHGMQVGKYLTIPADFQEQIATLGHAETQQMVRYQWEAWQARQTIPRQHVAALPSREEGTPTMGRQSAARGAEAPPPTGTQPTAVLLPTDKASSLVSVTELQTLLQGLEERLTRRLSPVPEEPKGAVAFVSASELQTTLQDLEARLTQRVEQMIQQRGGQVSPEQSKGQEPPRRTVTPLEAAPRTAISSASYGFLLLNVLLFLCGVILLWRWWRHLSVEERQARLTAWRARVTFRSAKAVDSGARQHR